MNTIDIISYARDVAFIYNVMEKTERHIYFTQDFPHTFNLMNVTDSAM